MTDERITVARGFMQTYAAGDATALLALLTQQWHRYHDLPPTGRTVGLAEMIFHRFDGNLIAESWRMTYPAGVYDALIATSAAPAG